MGKASKAKRQAREEKREQVSRLCRDKARRSRPRRQAQLEPLLGYLEREFPASLRDLPYARDLDDALGDTVVELLGNLVQVEDSRALALSEVFLAAYPDLPVAHWCRGQALGHAGSYYRAGAVLRRVLTDWPDFPAAASVRAQLEVIDSTIRQHCPGEEPELLAWRELVREAVESGHWTEARRLLDEGLPRWPGDRVTRNNLSLLQAHEGHLQQAIHTAEGVMVDDPGNLHALANLVRLLTLAGLPEQARVRAQELRTSVKEGWHGATKIAEALSWAGDDEGVLLAFQGCTQTSPLLYHLAAVAWARTGNWPAAQEHWNRALAADPSFMLARENLENSRLPEGERFSAWAFSPSEFSASLDRLETELRKHRSAAVRRVVKRLPALTAWIPVWLDRGHPSLVQLGVALAAEHPEATECLRDFALGTRGPDSLRMKAALTLLDRGLLQPGTVRMWCRGEWRELWLNTYTLNWDLTRKPHARAVEKIATEGLSALQTGSFRRAEELLQRALTLAPGEPDLLNNLAVVYNHTGRERQARQLMREIADRHPDYLHARTALASAAILRGEFEEARALLEPIRTRRSFHFSEFGALCGVEIQLARAQGQEAVATSWEGLWWRAEEADPDACVYRPSTMD